MYYSAQTMTIDFKRLKIKISDTIVFSNFIFTFIIY